MWMQHPLTAIPLNPAGLVRSDQNLGRAPFPYQFFQPKSSNGVLRRTALSVEILDQNDARHVSGRRLTDFSSGGAIVKTWGSLANR